MADQKTSQESKPQTRLTRDEVRWGTVQRELGEISAGMKAIRVDIREQNQRSSLHREEVRNSINQLHGKTDELAERHAVLSTEQKNTAAAVKDMEPVVEEMKALKNRGIGVLAAVGIAATAFGVSVGAAWDWLKTSIAGLFS